MPRTLRMAENMMRPARVDEFPSCLFKKFDEFSAFHGVYYTHFCTEKNESALVGYCIPPHAGGM